MFESHDMGFNARTRMHFLQQEHILELKKSKDDCAHQYGGYYQRRSDTNLANDPFLSQIFLVTEIFVPLIQRCYAASGGCVAVGEGQYSLLKLAFLTKKEETVDEHKDRLKHFIRL